MISNFSSAFSSPTGLTSPSTSNPSLPLSATLDVRCRCWSARRACWIASPSYKPTRQRPFKALEECPASPRIQGASAARTASKTNCKGLQRTTKRAFQIPSSLKMSWISLLLLLPRRHLLRLPRRRRRRLARFTSHFKNEPEFNHPRCPPQRLPFTPSHSSCYGARA